MKLAWLTRRRLIAALAALLVVAALVIWYCAYNHRIDTLVADLGSADYATRERAEDALGKVRSLLGVKRLIWHLGDKDAQSKSAEFALVFGMIGESAIEPLISAGARGASRPWYASPVVPDFVKVQLDDYIEASDARRRSLENSLPQMFQYLGKAAMNHLGAALTSPNVRVRSLAANALAYVTDADTIRPLIGTLCDADANIRRTAWSALSRVSQGSKRETIKGLTPAEIDLIADSLADRNLTTRRTASVILGESDNPAAAEKLAALLASSNPDTRILAALALSLRSDKRALPVLLAMIKERDQEHLGFGIGVLGRYDDPEAVSLVLAAFNGSADNTRYLAAWGLAQIIARKDASTAARETAERAVVEALAGDSDLRRRAVAHTLVTIKDARAIEPLKKEACHSDPSVRTGAVFALGNYDIADTVTAILVGLHDKEARVRSTAAFVLGRSRDPRVQEALISALKDSDSGVRDQAAQSLQLRKSLDVARKNGARIPDE